MSKVKASVVSSVVDIAMTWYGNERRIVDFVAVIIIDSKGSTRRYADW
jgi:hypothetical protein